MDAALFSSLLQSTSFAMATSDVRAYLNGLFVTCESGEVVVAGSDGHRMSLGRSRHLKSFVESASFFMSRKLVLELMKLLKGLDVHAPVHCFVGARFFRIASDGFLFSRATLEPQYAPADRTEALAESKFAKFKFASMWFSSRFKAFLK